MNIPRITRTDIVVFVGALLFTVLGVWLPARGDRSVSTSPVGVSRLLRPSAHMPELRVGLTQDKVLQSDAARVFAELSIQTPEMPSEGGERRPLDFVVVLDRSGSMAAENRLGYAKAALKQLIQILGEEDRFALVVFDDRASIYTRLGHLTPALRSSLLTAIDHMRPGGSTNIGSALELVNSMLSKERPSRVLLLSDGETNVGVTDPTALGMRAAALTEHNAVLSAIGLGLSFNEFLLSSLADKGMGNYSYLESPTQLETIFAQELGESRKVYAQASKLTFNPGPGVTLYDAGGYPIERNSSGLITVPTGRLMPGARKSFFLTLDMPARTLGEHSLGSLRLWFKTADGTEGQVEPSGSLVVAVLPAEKREEVVASVNDDVFRRNWSANTLGQFQRELTRWIREGNKVEAEKTISRYRSMPAAAGAVPEKLRASLASEVTKQSKEMEMTVMDVFSGSAESRQEKQDRAAKRGLAKSLKLQRAE